MCDYSLDLVASRPAKVGDKLVSTSFPHTIRCETGMLLSWRMGHRVAKFRQVDTDRSNVHHDALEFPDGKTILLTNLSKGQLATVLQLPVRSGVGANDAQRQNSTNVVDLVAQVN